MDSATSTGRDISLLVTATWKRTSPGFAARTTTFHSLLAPAASPSPYLSDPGLRSRWGKSARTLKRMRDRRQLPYYQEKPGAAVSYRREDIERIEAEMRVDATGRRRLRRIG